MKEPREKTSKKESFGEHKEGTPEGHARGFVRSVTSVMVGKLSTPTLENDQKPTLYSLNLQEGCFGNDVIKVGYKYPLPISL